MRRGMSQEWRETRRASKLPDPPTIATTAQKPRFTPPPASEPFGFSSPECGFPLTPECGFRVYTGSTTPPGEVLRRPARCAGTATMPPGEVVALFSGRRVPPGQRVEPRCSVVPAPPRSCSVPRVARAARRRCPPLPRGCEGAPRRGRSGPPRAPPRPPNPRPGPTCRRSLPSHLTPAQGRALLLSYP